MDMIDGIIVGAAAAAIGAVIASKFLNRQPVGGPAGNQPAISTDRNFGWRAPMYVVDLNPTPSNAAPVAQVNPNTEAANNVQPVEFISAFGAVANQPADEVVLPQ